MFAPTANPLAPKPAPQPNPVPAVQPQPVLAPPAVPPKPIKRSPVHPTLTPPAGPPDKTLTQLSGVPTSVADFNQRLEAVTAAHVAQTGVKPPPDVALHAALNPTPAPTVAPTVAQQALAKHPALTDGQFLDELRNAATNTYSYDQFVRSNSSRLEELLRDPAWRGKVNAVINLASTMHSGHGATPSPDLPTVSPTSPEEAAKLAAQKPTDPTVAAANIALEGAVPLDQLKKDAGIGFLAVSQITTSLVHGPVGIVLLLKAGALDTRDVVTFGATGKGMRLAETGQAQYHAIGQDIHHPAERPGFLFLDILGGVSVVGGGIARAGAAGRAFDAGEGASGAAKALLSKPSPRSYVINSGGFTEQTPLLTNPVMAWLQVNAPVLGLKARQARDDAGITLGPVGWATSQLSYTKKIGRAGDARKRVEYAAASAPVTELQHTAGHATAQSRILGALPGLNKGLTRGEQKALQIQSWDDPDPLAAERRFHENQIEQAQQEMATASANADRANDARDYQAQEKWEQQEKYWDGIAKNHRQQLADTALAEKALRNPSPRFEKALNQLAELMAGNERLRIQHLGLAPETAAGRIAKTGQVLRDEPVTGGTLLNDKAFYLPTISATKPGRIPSTVLGFYRSRLGPFGMSPTPQIAELTHEFNGDVMREGNMRIDTTNVAAETYGRTLKAISAKQDWQQAWDAAHPVPKSDRDVPIRDIKNVPDDLRAMLADEYSGYVPTEDLDALPADLRSVVDWLYPGAEKLKTEELANVRWINPDLLGNQASRAAVTGPGARFMDKINNVLRPAIFYIYPRYLLNKLGNDAMLVFDQGFLNAGGNLVRAMQAEKLYGADNAAAMRSIVGAGRQVSYTNPFSGRLNRALGEFWNKVADRDERVASFIHYARSLGYKTPEQMHALLNDEAHHSDLLTASQLGKKALVEYDNLSVYERNVIRHALFVWPWVRGSTIWSFRAVLEHPLKTDILAHLGEQAENYEDQWLPKAPAWMRRIGYIPVAWHNGMPLVANPSSAWTFSTLGSMLDIVRAGTSGDQYASASDLLGPISQFVVQGFTGRDAQGNRYQGSQIEKAAQDALNIIPILADYERQQRLAKQPKNLKPLKITDRASLQARLNSALKQSVLTPGYLGVYGNILAGGLSLSQVNLSAAAARYWRDATPAQKNQRQIALLNQMLGVQGEYLQRPVPPDVRRAVTEQAELGQKWAAYIKQLGNAREPTDKEQVAFTITYLEEKGELTKAQAAQFQGQLGAMDVKGDITNLRAALMTKYGHLGALAQWQTDVTTAAAITAPVLRQKVQQLAAVGVHYSAAAKPDELHSYALGYVKYLNERQAISHSKSPTKAADLREFDDNHTGAVNGLPGYTAFKWASMKPQQQADAVVRASTGPWSSLSAFDKQLAGRKVDPGTTGAWSELADLERQYRAKGESLTKDRRVFLAKYVDKGLGLKGAFYKDYLFAQEPLYQRVQYLRIVTGSPNRDGWHDLTQRAEYFWKAVQNKQTSAAGATTTWDNYIPEMEAYYQKEYPTFWHDDLQPLLKTDPKFVQELIH